MKKSIQLIMILAVAALFTAVSCKSSSSDPAPDPAGPKIVVTIDKAELNTGEFISVSGELTSGSNFVKMVGSVSFTSAPTAVMAHPSSKLKSLDVQWATSKDFPLESKTNLTLVNMALFQVPDNAAPGIYKLKLVAYDSANKTAEQIIPFEIY